MIEISVFLIGFLVLQAILIFYSSTTWKSAMTDFLTVGGLYVLCKCVWLVI